MIYSTVPLPICILIYRLTGLLPILCLDWLFLSMTQFKPDPRFEEAKQFIRSGAFGSYDYNPLLESLEGNTGYGRGDYFLVGYDFPSYMDAQAKVDEAYK